VVLVIDTNGMTRGIAPLLQGYQAFDDVNIAGVILNKVGGARHEGKLRAAVEEYTDIPVIGAVGRNPALDIGERHLGLTTPSETDHLDTKIAEISRIVGGQVDLDELMKIAATAPALDVTPTTVVTARFAGLRIGYARDRAFGFYYADDLDAFAAHGAELVPFNALSDTVLPDVDGLFLGGGFPETQMAALSANTALRGQIKLALGEGMPCYAECGGLMYLCRSMAWHGETHEMCNVVGADAVMCERPQGRGLVEYTTTPDHIWGQRDGVSHAHEFHYARLDNVDTGTKFGRKITRGNGIDGANDGIVTGNVLAGFCHQRNTLANPWIMRFLDFVQRVKTG
jgi:cobyrinic acid a,c-diamide synthase